MSMPSGSPQRWKRLLQMPLYYFAVRARVRPQGDEIAAMVIQNRQRPHPSPAILSTL